MWRLLNIKHKNYELPGGHILCVEDCLALIFIKLLSMDLGGPDSGIHVQVEDRAFEFPQD